MQLSKTIKKFLFAVVILQFLIDAHYSPSYSAALSILSLDTNITYFNKVLCPKPSAAEKKSLVIRVHLRKNFWKNLDHLDKCTIPADASGGDDHICTSVADGKPDGSDDNGTSDDQQNDRQAITQSNVDDTPYDFDLSSSFVGKKWLIIKFIIDDTSDLDFNTPIDRKTGKLSDDPIHILHTGPEYNVSYSCMSPNVVTKDTTRSISFRIVRASMYLPGSGSINIGLVYKYKDTHGVQRYMPFYLDPKHYFN